MVVGCVWSQKVMQNSRKMSQIMDNYFVNCKELPDIYNLIKFWQRRFCRQHGSVMTNIDNCGSKKTFPADLLSSVTIPPPPSYVVVHCRFEMVCLNMTTSIISIFNH